jgi:hypothetical protein
MSDVNELLAALKGNLGSSQEIIDTESLLQNKENLVSEFENDPLSATIRQLAENITVNKSILETARQLADQTGDPGYLEAFANISKANTENLKTLSLLISEKEKIQSVEKMKTRDHELKEKDLELKKELKLLDIASKEKIAEGRKAETAPKQQLIQNNTFLTASRDQVFDMLFSDGEAKKKATKEIMEMNGLMVNVEVQDDAQV